MALASLLMLFPKKKKKGRREKKGERERGEGGGRQQQNVGFFQSAPRRFTILRRGAKKGYPSLSLALSLPSCVLQPVLCCVSVCVGYKPAPYARRSAL